MMIQLDYPNTTFLFGDDSKYVRFITDHNIKRAIFTFDGNMRLFYELVKNGVSTKREFIDFESLRGRSSGEKLKKIFCEK